MYCIVGRCAYSHTLTGKPTLGLNLLHDSVRYSESEHRTMKLIKFGKWKLTNINVLMECDTILAFG